jgi:CRP-like cAMP-binding protein
VRNFPDLSEHQHGETALVEDPLTQAPEVIETSDPVSAEIEAALLSEDTMLADIWKRTMDGESPETIRVVYDNQRVNFVYNYLRTARAILDGEVPNGPTPALSAMRTLRRFMKDHEFSTATNKVLADRLSSLQKKAADQDALAVEERNAIAATVAVEEAGTPGVYVYVLPHYLRHPFDEESGRTLLKVGRADSSVIARFRHQTRTTALPEDPVLLRVYPCDKGESLAREAHFHTLLEAADHDRSTARTGGTEWFLTSTKFLDAIAKSQDMEIKVASDLADEAEA